MHLNLCLKMKGGLKSLERHVGIPLNTSKWDTRLQRVEAVLRVRVRVRVA